MKYIVYQMTNKENGKLYIGVHKTKNPEIFDNYVGNGIYIGYSLENPKTVYQHALKKYGYKSFVRTTLKVFDTVQEALAMEREIVTPEFVKQDNNYNTAVGGGYWVVYKTVYQFNNKKELIKTWEGNYEIAEYYGVSLNQIQFALHNKKIFKNSYFSYSQSPKFEEYTEYKNFILYQFDFSGNLINTYENTRDAATKLNYSFNSLQNAVTDKKLYKQCFWTHHDDQIWEIIKMNRLYAIRNNVIKQYDANNQFVQEFINMTTAAKELGYKYYIIKSAVVKNSLVDGKYYFRKENIVTKNDKVAQYDLEGNLIKVWDSIAQCAKIYPKAREVVKGQRNKTHGYTFKYIENN